MSPKLSKSVSTSTLNITKKKKFFFEILENNKKKSIFIHIIK